MGDRTSVTLEVPQAYKGRALDIIGGEPEEIYQDEHVFEGRWDEVNYGGEYEHQKLVKNSIPHILTWATGSAYGPGSVVFDGQNSYEVSLLFDELCVVVPVDPDGSIDPGDLANAVNYYQAAERIRQPTPK